MGCIVRLHNLALCIEEWRHEAIFAGMLGLGAEDAWYETALKVEYCKVKGRVITGGGR